RLGHEPALLLLVGRPLHERQRVEPDVDALHDPEGRVRLLELLADHREADVVHPAAAPLGVDRGAEQALLGHAHEHLAVDLALRVPVADERVDLRLAELADGLLDEAVLVGRAEVDHCRAIVRPREPPRAAILWAVTDSPEPEEAAASYRALLHVPSLARALAGMQTARIAQS